MKKLVCLLLVFVLCMPIFASCGEVGSKAVALNEKYEVLQVWIERSGPGKTAIVDFDDYQKDDYFFASDPEGVCYQILFNAIRFELVVKEGETVYVTYEKDGLKELTSGESDHGFVPRYELDSRSIWSVKAWELKDIANEKASEAFGVSSDALRLSGCYMNEYGKYEFTYVAYIADMSAGNPSLYLKENGEIERVDLGYKGEMLKYIGTEIERAIPAAKKRLQEQSGENAASPYFEERDGYVYLCTETIKSLSPDDPRYGKVGCGDHEHIFYREKLGKAIEEEKNEK